MAQDDDEDLPELNISAEKIEYIIIRRANSTPR